MESGMNKNNINNQGHFFDIADSDASANGSPDGSSPPPSGQVDIKIWNEKLVGKQYGGRATSNEQKVIKTFEGDVVYEHQLPSLHRVVTPDSMLTMDYIPDRLNVNIDENSKIYNVRYG